MKRFLSSEYAASQVHPHVGVNAPWREERRVVTQHKTVSVHQLQSLGIHPPLFLSFLVM